MAALDAGFRHIIVSHNTPSVSSLGRALELWGSREELFITVNCEFCDFSE